MDVFIGLPCIKGAISNSLKDDSSLMLDKSFGDLFTDIYKFRCQRKIHFSIVTFYYIFTLNQHYTNCFCIQFLFQNSVILLFFLFFGPISQLTKIACNCGFCWKCYKEDIIHYYIYTRNQKLQHKTFHLYGLCSLLCHTLPVPLITMTGFNEHDYGIKHICRWSLTNKWFTVFRSTNF